MSPVLKFLAGPAEYAWYLLTELRYESFGTTTAGPRRADVSAMKEYLAYLGIFIFLQLLPRTSVMKAVALLFAIWLLWTTIQFGLKYSDFPPLFGSIYHAENISLFWTET